MVGSLKLLEEIFGRGDLFSLRKSDYFFVWRCGCCAASCLRWLNKKKEVLDKFSDKYVSCWPTQAMYRGNSTFQAEWYLCVRVPTEQLQVLQVQTSSAVASIKTGWLVVIESQGRSYVLLVLDKVPRLVWNGMLIALFATARQSLLLLSDDGDTGYCSVWYPRSPSGWHHFFQIQAAGIRSQRC